MPTTTIDAHRGILRQTNCGSSRIPTTSGRSARGTHTVRRPLASARAVAVGHLIRRAGQRRGRHALGHPADDEPGPHHQQPHPRAVQRVGQPAGEPVQARLGRAVHVVGAAHPHPGHRREHDDRPGARRPHRGGQHRQQADLRDVVGVHDRRGVRGVVFGAGLVAEDAERQHRGADRAVLGDDRRDQRAVRGQVVGVELAHVHRRRARRPHGRDLLVELVGAPRRQHHGRAGGQPRGQLDADLAAAAENHDQPSARVLHGCDYVLR